MSVQKNKSHLLKRADTKIVMERHTTECDSFVQNGQPVYAGDTIGHCIKGKTNPWLL